MAESRQLGVKIGNGFDIVFVQLFLRDQNWTYFDQFPGVLAGDHQGDRTKRDLANYGGVSR
jgi:hypothetical protein